MQADIVSEVEELSARVGAIRAAVGRSIFGQDDVVDQTLITLLSGGPAQCRAARRLLGLAGASMVAHAAEAQRNFVSKEMPDQTLAPGESMEGFIYYTPVAKSGWSRGARMTIKLTDTKTHQPRSMTIPLSE